MSAILLLALGAWSWWSRPFPAVTELLRDPDRYAGVSIRGFVEAKTKVQTAEGFILEHQGRSLHIIAKVDEVPFACFVAVRGRFEPPDRLHAEAIPFMTSRRIKIAVSILPALLCVVLIGFSVRWDRAIRALILRQRVNHA